MTYKPTPYQIESNQRNAAMLRELAETAANLANVKALNLSPMNASLLWAEWHYFKAQAALDCDAYSEAFNDTCQALGVDDEGEPLPANSDDRGDYLYEQRRDAQMERELGL